MPTIRVPSGQQIRLMARVLDRIRIMSGIMIRMVHRSTRPRLGWSGHAGATRHKHSTKARSCRTLTVIRTCTATPILTLTLPRTIALTPQLVNLTQGSRPTSSRISQTAGSISAPGFSGAARPVGLTLCALALPTPYSGEVARARGSFN